MYKYCKSLTVLLLLFASVVGAQNVSGKQNLKIVDGDSLELDGRRIRLVGIDAPEYSQYCFDADNKKYDCGQKSLEYLKKLAKGKTVKCKVKSVDIYGRDLAICYADGKSLNLAMVRAGHAILYRNQKQKYVQAAKEAKAAKRGIYQGRYMAPEIYRRLHKRKKVQN